MKRFHAAGSQKRDSAEVSFYGQLAATLGEDKVMTGTSGFYCGV
jgi:hypothetical protein